MATGGHTTRQVHPILSAVAHITDELKTITDAPTWSLTDQETREALTELTHLTARLAAALPSRTLRSPRALPAGR